MPQEELPSHIPPPPPDPAPSTSAVPPPPTQPHGSAVTPPPPTAPAAPSVPPPVLTGPTTRTAPASEIPQTKRSWIIFWGVIVLFFWLTQSLFATVIAAFIGSRLMKQRGPSPQSIPAPQSSTRRKPMFGLLVSLGGLIFAFFPLIQVTLSPASEDALREGTDFRPLLMIFTIPIGIVIVVVGLSINAWQARRRK